MKTLLTELSCRLIKVAGCSLHPATIAGGAGRRQVHFAGAWCQTMEFFNSVIEVLQTLVVALGVGLGVWGAINLLEGYGNDNPGSNAHVP